MLRIVLALLLLVSLTLLGCTQPISGLPPGDVSESARLEMVRWHNDLRAAAGAGTLVANPKLMLIAQQQAEYNAFKARLDHRDAQGGLVSDRALSTGYSGAVSENLGYALSAAEVFSDWQSSASHHDALLDPQAREIGVGRALSGIYEFWVVVLGDPD